MELCSEANLHLRNPTILKREKENASLSDRRGEHVNIFGMSFVNTTYTLRFNTSYISHAGGCGWERSSTDNRNFGDLDALRCRRRRRQTRRGGDRDRIDQ